MDLNILDTSFNKMYIVDEYKSLIWNDRYNKAGDFELYVPASETNFQIFQNGYYITSDISDHVMIIEDMSVTTDVESGAFLIISGRSIESILDRRIVWTQTNISSYAYVYDAISRLLNDNICGSSIGNRRVPEFSQTLNIDVAVRSIRNIYDMQFTGDNLYDTIVKICNTYGIGFEMYLENNKFVFHLFVALDRSYAQNDLPYVEFSPNFDNLISSDYKLVTSVYKNVTLVAGEGEGIDRKTVSINSDVYSGLQRRELYTDARDLSTNVDGGTLTPAQYNEVLTNRGLAKLTETQVETNFDAKVDHTQPYIYGQDYYMGDIVQFQNQFGISYRVRVVESIYSESESGVEQYPTFEILEED